jgi:4-hydroxy-3-polyprenylbenzoate decarboxylase
MKIIISISGASGFSLGLKAFSLIPKNNIEKHLILSEHSRVVAQKELNLNLDQELKNIQNIVIHDEKEIGASIASGSFQADIMMIIPCSMNTLAKISVGIADNLTTRSASVMLKENKKLLIAPREMPFNSIHLENMHKLSQLGVIIAPPVIAYYSEQQSLEQMENFLIGKWFDLVGIKHDLYKRWS